MDAETERRIRQYDLMEERMRAHELLDFLGRMALVFCLTVLTINSCAIRSALEATMEQPATSQEK